MKFLSFFLIIVFSSFSWAESLCLPTDASNQVLQDFNISGWSDEDNTWKDIKHIDICDSSSLVNSIVKSILYMQQIPSASETSVFQSVVMQQGPIHFFKSRIKNILVETNNHSFDCFQGGVVAYVDRNEKSTMHICPDGIKNYSSTMMMSYVLLHEARHTDGFSHVTCTHGTLSKFKAKGCDADYETQGSYGVGTAFLLDVYRSTQNPVQKQEVRSNAVIDLVQRFNRLPLGLVEGAVTQSKAGDIAFFDGLNQFPLNMAPNFGVMSSRDDAAVFFGRDGSAKTYLYSDKLAETEGGFAKQYRTEFSEDDQNSLVDLVFSGNEETYSCFLFERKILCAQGTDSDVVVSLNAIKPVGLIYTEGAGLLTSKSIYIASADGFIYQLPATLPELRRSSESDFVKMKKPMNLTSLVTLTGKGEFAIDLTGQFSSYQSAQRKWTVVPAYKGQSLKKVISPYIWSKQIEDL